MFRIYEVQSGTRRLLGGTTSMRAAQAFVIRVAGNPMIPGAAMGGYRGPNEFLPRTLTGAVRYEIVESPRLMQQRPAAA